jgi:hypothetical protein
MLLLCPRKDIAAIDRPEARREASSMPMIVKGFLLLFGPLIGLIVLIACAAFLRRVFRRSGQVMAELSGRSALSVEDAQQAAEFHARRRRFHLWLWGGVAGAIAALEAGWFLTAVAAGVFAPLAGAVICLRCPACDTTPTLKGLVDRGRCRRCGAYLGA